MFSILFLNKYSCVHIVFKLASYVGWLVTHIMHIIKIMEIHEFHQSVMESTIIVNEQSVCLLHQSLQNLNDSIIFPPVI